MKSWMITIPLCIICIISSVRSYQESNRIRKLALEHQHTIELLGQTWNAHKEALYKLIHLQQDSLLFYNKWYERITTDTTRHGLVWRFKNDATIY